MCERRVIGFIETPKNYHPTSNHTCPKCGCNMTKDYDSCGWTTMYKCKNCGTIVYNVKDCD